MEHGRRMTVCMLTTTQQSRSFCRGNKAGGSASKKSSHEYNFTCCELLADDTTWKRMVDS